MLNDEDVRRGMRIAGGIAVGLLVKGAFDDLERMTSGRHLSADELRQAVESVGEPLVETPDWEWAKISITPSTGECPAGFDFGVPLWTAGGGTGIGLSLHMIPTSYGTFELEIEGFVPVEASVAPDLRDEPTPTTIFLNAGSGPGQPSESPVPERWRPVLSSIIHRLVIGDYAGLAADGLVSYTDDPTDTSIGRWIEEYPATLVDLPPEAWTYSEHAPWVGQAQSWWVIVDLWTAEEGRSDLSMEATVWDDGTSIVAQVDNVHVM